MIRVALVGAGGMGGVHLGVYESMEDVELVAVVEIEIAKALSKIKGKNVKIYDNIDEMLKNEKVDLIDICTPSYLHPEHAIKAMDNGINVICEKPLALSVEDAEKMEKSAERNNVLFMTAHVIRFWPEYMYLKKVYDEGTLGQLYHADFSRIGGRPKWSWQNWMMDEKKSGLVPLDLHIHDADYIYYLLGEPKAVSGNECKDGEKVNYLSAVYEYEKAFVRAEAAWYDCSLPFSMSYRAVFEKGIVEYKNGKLTVYENGKEAKEIKVDNEVMENSGINISSAGGYSNEIRYFVDCVKSGKKPAVITPQESVNCLKILYKLKEALKKAEKVFL